MLRPVFALRILSPPQFPTGSGLPEPVVFAEVIHRSAGLV